MTDHREEGVIKAQSQPATRNDSTEALRRNIQQASGKRRESGEEGSHADGGVEVTA